MQPVCMVSCLVCTPNSQNTMSDAVLGRGGDLVRVDKAAILQNLNKGNVHHTAAQVPLSPTKGLSQILGDWVSMGLRAKLNSPLRCPSQTPGCSWAHTRMFSPSDCLSHSVSGLGLVPNRVAHTNVTSLGSCTLTNKGQPT